MKRGLTFLLVLLPVLISAQEVGKRLEIRNLKGMNTTAGDMVIQPNEARVCNNIMLSNPYGRSADVGSLTKRKGYDSVSTRSGIDSLLGISGQQLSDGRKFLAFATDAQGVGYGGLYVTNYGSNDLSSATQITNYWSVQNPTSFAMLGDVMYAVNGDQRGVYWDGTTTRSFPLNTPGEPRIVPITRSASDSVYDFSGQYRYVFRVKVFGARGATTGLSQTRDFSRVSAPIRLNLGRVYVMDVPFPEYDSVISKIDSAQLNVYRTKANPGPLDQRDMFYRVGRGDSTTIHGVNFNSLILIDSLPDTALSATDTFSVARIIAGPYDRKHRYGGLGFSSRKDSAGNGIFGSLTLNYTGITAYPGVVYISTFVDTVNGIESDSGKSLWIGARKTIDSCMKRVYLSLPKSPYGITGVLKNIYRAQLYLSGHDVIVKDSVKTWIGAGPDAGTWKWIVFSTNRWVTDTLVPGPFYLCDQKGLNDTIMIDSLTFDSLRTKRVFQSEQPPALLSQIFSFNGKMYGIQGSRVYRSSQDSGSVFNLFTFQPINEADGDLITTAWPTRTAIRVFKNSSNYNIYDDFGKTEVSGYFGCVAPFSHVAGLGGHYYASASGIVREQDGPTLERTFGQTLVSHQINSFKSMSSARRSKIVAAYIPESQKAFFCTGDTTYIYDELADGWTTATGFVFAGATLYDTETVISHTPSKTMYFYKPGGKTIYTYGTSELDNGNPVLVSYESGPLLVDYGYEQVKAIGMLTHGCTVSDKFQARLLDPLGAVLNSGGVITMDSLTACYATKETGASKPAWYQRLQFYNTPAIAEWYSGSIDGFDIFYTHAEDWKFR